MNGEKNWELQRQLVRRSIAEAVAELLSTVHVCWDIWVGRSWSIMAGVPLLWGGAAHQCSARGWKMLESYLDAESDPSNDIMWPNECSCHHLPSHLQPSWWKMVLILLRFAVEQAFEPHLPAAKDRPGQLLTEPQRFVQAVVDSYCWVIYVMACYGLLWSQVGVSHIYGWPSLGSTHDELVRISPVGWITMITIPHMAHILCDHSSA